MRERERKNFFTEEPTKRVVEKIQSENNAKMLY